MAYNCWLESQISNGLKLDRTLASCRSYQFTHHIQLCSSEILNESTRTCVDLFALPEYHQEYSMDSDHKQKLVHVICSSCVALLSYLYYHTAYITVVYLFCIHMINGATHSTFLWYNILSNPIYYIPVSNFGPAVL